MSSSIQSGICLRKEPISSQQDQNLYSQIIGSLLYAIVNTRLDCAHLINSLAQYLTIPTIHTFKYLKKIFDVSKTFYLLAYATKNLYKVMLFMDNLMLIGLDIKIHIALFYLLFF